ncbi:MAG: class I SAM-dependent methyltransferase [Candidatus Promineifilaceae bacterium]
MLSLDRQNALREAYQTSHPGWRPATELFAAWARELLPPQGRLLDVGCGRGGLIEQLGHSLELVTGVDPDPRSLAEHRLGGRLARAAARAGSLPFANAAFDLALASWLLEHLARPEEALAEIGRVLKPGGALVFITPNRRHPLVASYGRLGRLARAAGRQPQLVSHLYGRAAADTFRVAYRANSQAELRGLAAGAGLALARLAVVPDPTYLALAPRLLRPLAWLERRLGPGRGVHLVGVLRKG